MEINQSELSGPKELLEGPSGTGKTWAIGTMVDWAQAHNKQVFCLFVEQGLETLLGYWMDKGAAVPECLHWHQQLTKPIGLSELITGADNVARLSYESLTKLTDATRAQNNVFKGILQSCSDFPDDRTGQKFGAVDSWDTSRIFALDSLSELSNAAAKMTIGNKPMMSQPEYLVTQNNIMNFLRLLTQGCRCTVLLTAHVQRQQDEVVGSIRLMTKAIGKAIADDIPPLFSDVIYSVREGTNFYWETAAANVDTKARNLPIQSKLPVDFAQVMNKWQSRGGK